MKLSTIALAGALVLSSTYAFAQAGEGDAGYAGMSGGGYGRGFSSAFGAMTHTGRMGGHTHGNRRSDHHVEH